MLTIIAVLQWIINITLGLICLIIITIKTSCYDYRNYREDQTRTKEVRTLHRPGTNTKWFTTSRVLFHQVSLSDHAPLVIPSPFTTSANQGRVVLVLLVFYFHPWPLGTWRGPWTLGGSGVYPVTTSGITCNSLLLILNSHLLWSCVCLKSPPPRAVSAAERKYPLGYVCCCWQLCTRPALAV